MNITWFKAKGGHTRAAVPLTTTARALTNLQYFFDFASLRSLSHLCIKPWSTLDEGALGAPAFSLDGQDGIYGNLQRIPIS